MMNFFERIKAATENPACIGCGYCCWKVPCDLAVRAYPSVRDWLHTPCPELVWSKEKNRHFCAAYLRARGDMKRYIDQVYLHIGAGCCSSMNDWRFEPLQDRTQYLKL